MITALMALIGNLIADPEIVVRNTKNGPKRILSLAFAEGTQARDDEGNFHDMPGKPLVNVTLWENSPNAANLATNIMESLKKGHRIVVVGTNVATRTWVEAASGERKFGINVENVTTVAPDLSWQSAVISKSKGHSFPGAVETDPLAALGSKPAIQPLTAEEGPAFVAFVADEHDLDLDGLKALPASKKTDLLVEFRAQASNEGESVEDVLAGVTGL